MWMKTYLQQKVLTESSNEAGSILILTKHLIKAQTQRLKKIKRVLSKVNFETVLKIEGITKATLKIAILSKSQNRIDPLSTIEIQWTHLYYNKKDKNKSIFKDSENNVKALIRKVSKDHQFLCGRSTNRVQ